MALYELITDDIGQVKLGGMLLPGVFEGLEVSGGVRVDESDVAGQSGTSKQPAGFDDTEFSLKLRLLTDDDSTCYDKLRILTSLFKRVDSSAKPFIYQIVNHHLAQWDVSEVIFKGIRSSEDNQDDTIHAELQFTEFRPVVVKAESLAADPPESFSPPTYQSEQQAFIDEKLATRKYLLSLSAAKDDDKPPKASGALAM